MAGGPSGKKGTAGTTSEVWSFTMVLEGIQPDPNMVSSHLREQGHKKISEAERGQYTFGTSLCPKIGSFRKQSINYCGL